VSRISSSIWSAPTSCCRSSSDREISVEQNHGENVETFLRHAAVDIGRLVLREADGSYA